jgi:TatD DNase family protein
MFIDTHCHIHESALFPLDKVDEAVQNAIANDVTKIIGVGTNGKSSVEAVEFAEKYAFCYAIIGIHPHDANVGVDSIGQMLRDAHDNGVGVGEIGLDYYYNHSPKDMQISALEKQLQWAIDYNLPVSFHVREAFDDFWPILANFSGVRGVLHSFTDNMSNLERGGSEGLYVAVNGISTFTKDENQRKIFDAIPLDRLLLETDAPFLTPAPYRGKVNEPAFVRHVAEYHANRRRVELEHLARVTSVNASTLFSI